MAEPILEILSRLPLFKGLKPEALAVIVPALRPAKFEAGQALFRQGETGRTAFVVVRGEVRVDVATPMQGTIAVASLGPGEVVGEIALVDPGQRTATATAVQPTACVTLTTDALHALGEGRPDVVAVVLLNLSRTVSARLRALDRTLAAAMAADPAASGTRSAR